MPGQIIYLTCLIIGDNRPFFITAPSTFLIGALKKLIKEEATDIRGVDSRRLILWKPKDTMVSCETFVENLQTQARLSEIAYQLNPLDLVQNAFQDQTQTQTLHILVEIQPGEGILTLDQIASSVGGDATDCAVLEARGYELEPQSGVDESGCAWASLSNMPSHILVVYRWSDPTRKFIAKKVHEESNELEIFKLLDTFQPKSEHIISLHDSFQTQSTWWAILPEMSSIANIVSIAPKQLHGKVSQVCWGLIKGVAYLHKFYIAHRDIKPQNLVVDKDFCLKIIDFDVSIEVEDENEEVDGQCGTKGWMAPEIEEKSRYSPIKADRWSSGQVILCLLDELSEEDAVLRTIVKNLMVHDPNKRPSMLQVTLLPSDVATVVKKKTPRSLQDVGGENRNPPRTKKQKLSV